MDEESKITIREELSEDFNAMAQLQTKEIRTLLEEFEDYQLQLSLELEAYKRERVQRVKKQMGDNQPEQLNISDEEQPVVGPKLTHTENQQSAKRAEQSEELEPL